MPIKTEDKMIKFIGAINETELPALREFLITSSPDKIKVDFTECRDIHTATLQLILAYHSTYGCEYIFNNMKSAFRLAIEGFSVCEDDSSQ